MSGGRTAIALLMGATCAAALGQGAESLAFIDTATAPQEQSAQDTAHQRTYNPLLAFPASAIVPGLGQAYTRKVVKGGLFLATEVIMGLVALNRYDGYTVDRDAATASLTLGRDAEDSFADIAADSAAYLNYAEWYATFGDTSRAVFEAESARYQSSYDTLYGQYQHATMDHELDSYDERLGRAVFFHSACWLAGCHVFNLMDALQSTGRFVNDEPRNPTVAGLLSAVPFLGLGQIYNGSLSKVGVVCMVQTALGYMAYNYHSLMRESEGRLAELENTDSPRHRFGTEYDDLWQSRRSYAQRQRNTYLWYGLLFYFYGIFDAVVDAHLHDMHRQMQLKPDLAATAEGVWLRVICDF